jgi:hypothetical protein
MIGVARVGARMSPKQVRAVGQIDMAGTPGTGGTISKDSGHQRRVRQLEVKESPYEG